MEAEKIVLDYLKERSFMAAGLAEAMKECKNQLGALKTSLRGRVD
jgi:hypothetical protein